MYRFIVLSLVLFCISCQTVTISPPGETVKYPTPPDYMESQSFFLWGLVGEARINVASICGDRNVKQMQSQATFLDGLLRTITGGIYSPRTAFVWCGEKAAAEPEEGS